MKTTLYASVAVACLIGAPAFAAGQSAQQERHAQAQTQQPPGAAKSEGGAAQRPGGAADKSGAPGAAQMHDEKAGGPAGARGADANKPGENPSRAGAEPGKGNPAAAEKKPDKAEEKADRARDNDKATAQGKADKSKDNAADANTRGDRDETRDKADRTRDKDHTRDNADRARDKTRDNADRTREIDRSRDNARNGRDEMRTGDRDPGSRIQLDERQRTRLTTFFQSHRGPRVDRVDFSISVGTRIPSHVHVATLPSEIVEIVPEYRGYEYVIVQDEIVIVRPGTREIVTVLPASTSAAARGTKLDPCGNRT